MSGITDPNEPYFKDGAWGWDGTVWRRLPMLWGYSEPLSELVSELNANAPTDFLITTPVDPGQLWVVEAICAVDATTDITSIQISYSSAPGIVMLKDEDPAGKNRYVFWSGRLTMTPGRSLCVEFVGTVIGDNIHVRYSGYKMNVAE